jgi:hypothetical protein
LDSLEPFRRAASPTLREATASAPALSQLGTRAAPVLRRAQPALGALSSLARTAPPLTTALDTGIDDLLGFVQGWARAIQSRDGPGHIFRGHVSLGPAAIRSAVSNLLRQPGARRKPRGRSDDSNRVAPSHAAPASPSSPTPPKPAATPDSGLLNIIPGAVDELLQPLTGRLPLDKLGFPAQDDQRLGPLLDYLLRP